MDLERERLRRANHLVDRVVSEIPDAKDEFASLSNKLPSLLANSGLLLTVAYLMKRQKTESKEKSESLILQFIFDWFRDRGLLSQGEIKEDYLNTLLNLEEDRVSLLMDEALAISEVLKLVSNARLGKGGG